MVKTDYPAHDARYRQLREEGAPGWDTAADYRECEVEIIEAYLTAACELRAGPPGW